MFKRNEIKTIKSLLNQQEKLMKDEYSAGVYNGIELALSVLECREPMFKFIQSDPEVVEKEEQTQRIGKSMIIKRNNV